MARSAIQAQVTFALVHGRTNERGAVATMVGKCVVPIDALLFDKIPESNWKVPGPPGRS